jgi:hypothetical protein
MEPLIRMFTSEAGTVRWETSIAGVEGLEFKVAGPDDWRTATIFADTIALLTYQEEYERFLRASGYSVSLVNDRRWRGERRERPRGQDRRL